MLLNDRIDPLFNATVLATEEAIVNAIVAARDMTGDQGHTVHAIDQPVRSAVDVIAEYDMVA